MQRLKAGEIAPDFKFNTLDACGLRFYESLAERNILFFSRYIGCPLCQLKLMEMARSYGQLVEMDTQVFFIMQSSPGSVRERNAQLSIRFPIVLDPAGDLYRLYGAAPARSQLGLLSFNTMRMLRAAKKQGLLKGASEGDKLQLPATFIVDSEHIIRYARYGKDAADIPDILELLVLLA